MPKRSEKRESAKAEYLARRARGEAVNLRELAEAQGVTYQLLRNWKSADKWDAEVRPKRKRRSGGSPSPAPAGAPSPAGGGKETGGASHSPTGADERRDEPKRKRGGQPGNRNSAGHRNAAGSHAGAPEGNKNAEKDGAYSAVLFDMLTDAEKTVAEAAPTESRAALIHEMQLLKVREHRIMEKIAQYEAEPEDTLHLSSVLDMREPAGKGQNRTDGARQQMGMYTKDSAFNRVLKLQEALYKVQGRIAAIANALRAAEETDRRMEIERERLEILRMRATGAVEIELDEGQVTSNK